MMIKGNERKEKKGKRKGNKKGRARCFKGCSTQREEEERDLLRQAQGKVVCAQVPIKGT